MEPLRTPTFYVLDPKGVIRYKWLGPAQGHRRGPGQADQGGGGGGGRQENSEVKAPTTGLWSISLPAGRDLGSMGADDFQLIQRGSAMNLPRPWPCCERCWPGRWRCCSCPAPGAFAGCAGGGQVRPRLGQEGRQAGRVLLAHRHRHQHEGRGLRHRPEQRPPAEVHRRGDVPGRVRPPPGQRPGASPL